MTPTLTAPHSLDAAVALEPVGPGRFRGATTPEYWNMAGPFGGTTAAIMLKAVLDHPQRRGRPVAQTVNFCAAMAEGSSTSCVLVHAGSARSASISAAPVHRPWMFDDLLVRGLVIFAAGYFTIRSRSWRDSGLGCVSVVR